MKRKKTIAVDFDGTVVKHEFPKIGAEVLHAVEVLKRLNENDMRIIVWTMRCGEHLEVQAKNKKFGKDTVRFGNVKTEGKWKMKKTRKSQSYTTN